MEPLEPLELLEPLEPIFDMGQKKRFFHFFEKIDMKNITVGEVTIWDFGFRYHLALMDIEELNVLMIKYEVELKRTSPLNKERLASITDILGKLYKEIMKRKLVNKIELVTNT